MAAPTEPAAATPVGRALSDLAVWAVDHRRRVIGLWLAALNVDMAAYAAAESSRSESRVLPVTLLAFGALGAAASPLMAGTAAVLVATGLISLVARIMPLSVVATNVASMLGLGLGIDYALFVVTRIREERRGRGRRPARPCAGRPGIPIPAFCVSMDYEVFLISRIQEAHAAGLDDRRAVVAGLRRSGGVITSAAAIMTMVFVGFALTDLLMVKMLGVVLTLGIVLDATLVRLLLVPSLLVLMGRYNWLPGDRWLSRQAAGGASRGGAAATTGMRDGEVT